MTLPTILAVLLLVPGLAAQEQSPGKRNSDISLESVRSDTKVSIRINLHNTTEKPVFVPTCGELRGKKYLCDLTVHLEEETPRGWQPPKLKFDSMVLGGIRPESGVVIEPGQSVVFVCEFVADLFKLSPGRKLRLIVDTWSDEASMKAMQAPSRLVSPVFKKP